MRPRLRNLDDLLAGIRIVPIAVRIDIVDRSPAEIDAETEPHAVTCWIVPAVIQFASPLPPAAAGAEIVALMLPKLVTLPIPLPAENDP